MSAELKIPLDIPDVEILSTVITTDNRLIIEVESSLETTRCGICGREIACRYGDGQERILRHLSVLNMRTYIKFKPRRGECGECEYQPTTTQVVEWYTERSPHTNAYDKWLMKQLVNTTVEDVSMREAIGYDAVLGALDRQVDVKINWAEIDELGTIGIDEIAMKKGRKNYAAVVTARHKDGQTRVLAVLPDRKNDSKDISRTDSGRFTQDYRRCSELPGRFRYVAIQTTQTGTGQGILRPGVYRDALASAQESCGLEARRTAALTHPLQAFPIAPSSLHFPGRIDCHFQPSLHQSPG